MAETYMPSPQELEDAKLKMEYALHNLTQVEGKLHDWAKSLDRTIFKAIKGRADKVKRFVRGKIAANAEPIALAEQTIRATANATNARLKVRLELILERLNTLAPGVWAGGTVNPKTGGPLSSGGTVNNFGSGAVPPDPGSQGRAVGDAYDPYAGMGAGPYTPTIPRFAHSNQIDPLEMGGGDIAFPIGADPGSIFKLPSQPSTIPHTQPTEPQPTTPPPGPPGEPPGNDPPGGGFGLGVDPRGSSPPIFAPPVIPPFDPYGGATIPPGGGPPIIPPIGTGGVPPGGGGGPPPGGIPQPGGGKIIVGPGEPGQGGGVIFVPGPSGGYYPVPIPVPAPQPPAGKIIAPPGQPPCPPCPGVGVPPPPGVPIFSPSPLPPGGKLGTEPPGGGGLPKGGTIITEPPIPGGTLTSEPPGGEPSVLVGVPTLGHVPGPSINLGDPNECKELLTIPGEIPPPGMKFSEYMGFKTVPNPDGSGNIMYAPASMLPFLQAGNWQFKEPATGKTIGSIEVGSALHRMCIWVLDAFQNILTRELGSQDCNKPKLTETLLAKIFYGWINTLGRGALDRTLQTLQYQENFLCPNAVASQADLNAGFLREAISKDEWECLTKANNNPLDINARLLYSQRQQPGISELIQMLYRKMLSKQQFLNLVRQAGWLNPVEAEAMVKIAEFIPTYQDLVRMMVRDVEDDAIVTKEELDKYFNVKFKGTLKLWAEQQGIPPEVMLYIWRAHWDYPSNTQTYEMVARLRPGRVPKDVETTMPDAEQLLTINDMAPRWVKRLIAVSYLPLGRIDIRRAYAIGAFGEPLGKAGFAVDGQNKSTATGAAEIEMMERYQDQRYAKAEAELLAYYTALEFDRSRKSKGVSKIQNTVCSMYQTGLITEQQGLDLLVDRGVKLDDAREFFRICDLQRTDKLAKAQVAAIKRLYSVGKLTSAEAISQLLTIGIEQERVGEIVSLWDQSNTKRSKEATAQQLCQWRTAELIDSKMMLSQLTAMGYSPTNATLIVRKCELDIEEKNAKAERAIESTRVRQERDSVVRTRRLSEAERRKRFALRTIPRLQKWLRSGIISESEFVEAIVDKGHDPLDAQRLLSETRGKR